MFILSRDPARSLAVELCQRFFTPWQMADEIPSPNSQIAISSLGILTPAELLHCLQHNIRVNTPRIDTQFSSGMGQHNWPLLLELIPVLEQAAGVASAPDSVQTTARQERDPTTEDAMKLMQATEAMRSLKAAHPESREIELALALLEGRDPDLPGDRTEQPPAAAPAGAVRIRFESGKYADPDGLPVEKEDAAVFANAESAETWLGLAINRKLHDPTFPREALPPGEADCEPVEEETPERKELEREMTPEELHLARLKAELDAMPDLPQPAPDAPKKRGRKRKAAAEATE